MAIPNELLIFIVCRLQDRQQKFGLRNRIPSWAVMMAADQFHRQGSCACLAGQVRPPPGMMFRHYEWLAPSARSPCGPTSCGSSEKMASQHDHDPVEDGKRHKDFSHIVQQCSRQQVWRGVPGAFQTLEYLVSMHLFRRLQSSKEDELCRIEMKEQYFARYALAWAEQGIPELA